MMRDTDDMLFTTVVGSHMWKMNNPESDVDLAHVFLMPTIDLLSGMPYRANLTHLKRIDPVTGVEFDETFQEAGDLVNKLLKGKIDAVWKVCSPIVLNRNQWGTVPRILEELREITMANLSKASYSSIRGMAVSQAADEFKRPRMTSGKGYRTAYRTIQLGIRLFKTGELAFDPVEWSPDIFAVNNALLDLSDAVESSHLPENPDPAPFRKWLLDLRLKNIAWPNNIPGFCITKTFQGPTPPFSDWTLGTTGIEYTVR